MNDIFKKFPNHVIFKKYGFMVELLFRFKFNELVKCS